MVVLTLQRYTSVDGCGGRFDPPIAFLKAVEHTTVNFI